MAGRKKTVFSSACAAIVLIGAEAAAAVSLSPRLKPVAPGPEYMTRLDAARLKTIHASLEKKQYSLARAELRFVEDETARSLGEWFYFMSRDPNVSVIDADRFLDAHPEWPAVNRIQDHAERELSDTTPVADILAFFESRAPRTGTGKIQLARAYLSQRRKDDATALIRDAWINHNFKVSDERRILNAYGSRLTKADHAARVDRLLWARQVTNARRTFVRLGSRDRAMAEARAALLLGAASGPRLYEKLSQDEQRDSGVLHAAVRYYRRAEQETYAIALAGNAPDRAGLLRNADRWWTERRLLLQWALKEGRFGEAYKTAAENGMSEGGDFADAEFVAGWIALRFLNEPQRARTHFEAMTGGVGTPISLSRGHYWIGRAARASGDMEDARTHFAEAAKHHYSFYGQLAAEKLGEPQTSRNFESTPAATPSEKALFNSRPAVAALRMLSDLNLDYEFMVFAYHVDDLLEKPGEFLELAKLTNGEGAPHLTVRAGKVATQSGAFAADVAYPLVFIPDEARAFVKPELVLALSRQESEFNPRAFSRAGARGVMQLIPSTAQLTARKEGLPYNRSALLDDPIYNMTLGSAHLSHLLDRYDGSLIMTFAAYNAGPHRVTQWVERYGDPRTDDIDPLDWIELIPFSETRNYVQRVLENIQVYRGRLGAEAIPGRLAADIERGGPSSRVATSEAAPAKLSAIAMSRGTATKLADLPAQTALLAARFRDAHTSSPDALPPAETAPGEAATLERPRERHANNIVMPDTPALAAPTAMVAAIPAEAAPIAQPVATPVGQPEAQTTKAPKIDADLTDAQPLPAQPTATRPEPLPDPEPSVTPDPSLAPTIAQPRVAAATTPPSDVTTAANRTLAADIVAKSSERLDVDAESEADALAAAIARGLDQLAAAETPVSNPGDQPSCDRESGGLATDRALSAAELNARMALRLSGNAIDPGTSCEDSNDPAPAAPDAG